MHTDKNGKVELWTRHHSIITHALPNLRKELEMYLPCDTIIDGELLKWRKYEVKEVFYAFSIIKKTGKLLLDNTETERRGILEATLPITKHITMPERVWSNKLDYYKMIIANGGEGIVIKKANAPYRIGYFDCPEVSHWIKVKPANLRGE